MVYFISLYTLLKWVLKQISSFYTIKFQVGEKKKQPKNKKEKNKKKQKQKQKQKTYKINLLLDVFRIVKSHV